ncbi:MAG: lipid A biosynthesis acyltransferase [Betaproteobacteria bacterium]
MRLILALIWLLHWLPLPVLGRIGELFGDLLYVLMRERRQITLTNLSLCFPDSTAPERRSLARAHFRSYARSVLERGVLWWGSPARLERLIEIDPEVPTQSSIEQPTIFLCPHFVCLEVAGVAITMRGPLCSIYTQQRNKVFDQALRDGRARFASREEADRFLISRGDGIKPIIRAMRNGRPFLMLPDMDFGPRESIFVPFFGVPAATLTAPARLAATTNGQVIPVTTHFRPNYQGWRVCFHPAWKDFPGDDIAAATRRMNAFIETQVKQSPAEYFWSHKRFKTRPEGTPSVYA